MNNKEKQIIGAINYLVLYLANHYVLYNRFLDEVDKKMEENREFSSYDSYIYRHPMVKNFFNNIKKDNIKRELSKTFFEEKHYFKLTLENFNSQNDFSFSKILLIPFLLSIVTKKELLFSFWTDMQDFYFFPDPDKGIILKGLKEILENRNEELFFETNLYSSTIKKFFSSKEELKEVVLNSFFEDKCEGEKILDCLEKNIKLCKFNCGISNLAKDKLLYWSEKSFSFRVFKNNWRNEYIEDFCKSLLVENFS